MRAVVPLLLGALLVAPAIAAVPQPAAWEWRFVASMYTLIVPCSSTQDDVVLRAVEGATEGVATFEIEYEGHCTMGGTYVFEGRGSSAHGWEFTFGPGATQGGLFPDGRGGAYLSYQNLFDHVHGETGSPTRLL